MSRRSLLPAWACVVVIFTGRVALGIGAPIEPSLVMSVTDAVGLSGSTQSVEVRFSNSFHAPIAGWSLGVCHDSMVLDITGAVSGSTVATINGGGPPDFEQVNVIFEGTEPLGTSPGANQAVVISFLGSDSLPIGSGYELLVLEYFLEGPNGTVTEVELCDDTQGGTDPVQTVIVCACTVSPAPLTVPGTIAIEDQSTFQRGDCTDDGAIDIADPIAALSFAFLGGDTPTCLDACDSDDDGVVGLGDAIWTVSWLFIPGAPAIPGPTVCGDDSTVDSIDCRGAVSCP